MVKTQLAMIPKPNPANNKSTQDLSKVLDDHMDRERRKGNVVVHNLPKQPGCTVMERSEKDISLFSTMLKEVMKIHVVASKSFRVGRKSQDKPRLLIVALDNPACKQDILRGARQLRHTEQYSNIYITPDLTQKEREESRKLRDELAVCRRAGETNLTIRGGRIIQLQSTEGAGSSYRNPGGRSTEHVGKHSAASAHIEEITSLLHQIVGAANRKPSQHQVRVNRVVKMAPLHSIVTAVTQGSRSNHHLNQHMMPQAFLLVAVTCKVPTSQLVKHTRGKAVPLMLRRVAVRQNKKAHRHISRE